jgi:hypothetical protein
LHLSLRIKYNINSIYREREREREREIKREREREEKKKEEEEKPQYRAETSLIWYKVRSENACSRDARD